MVSMSLCALTRNDLCGHRGELYLWYPRHHYGRHCRRVGKKGIDLNVYDVRHI